MERQIELKNSKDIIVYLVTKFPYCFTLTGETKPLKIGIFQDIISELSDDAPVSRTQLRVALRVYTSSWRYLKCIKEGVARVDLAGELGEPVDAQHMEYAQEKLKESQALAKTNKPSNNKNKPRQAQVEGGNNETKPHRVAKPKNKPDPQASPSPVKKKPLVAIPDISVLKVGQQVNVSMGSDVIAMTVSEIKKEVVTVILPSGLELMVRKEYIVI